MLERARRLLLQLADQRVGHVAELDQAGVGHQVEEALEEVDQRIAGHRQHRADEQAQQRRPHIARHQFGGVEAQVGQRQHAEGDQRGDELLPAAVEVAERERRHHAGHEEHHEEHGAVVAENQQRQQRHHVERHHETVLHEGLQQQGHEGEGHVVERLLVHADEDQRRQRAQQEDRHHVRETGIIQDPLVVQQDGQVQQRHEDQGDQDVAQQHQGRRTGVAHVGLEFTLVGIEHLRDLARHDLVLLDDQLAGVDIARGRRHARHGLSMHQLRGLLVEEQVRHQQLIGPGGAQQRIHVGIGQSRKVGQQARARIRQAVHFGEGHLGRALVALDIKHFRVGSPAPAVLVVSNHAPLVDGAEGGHGGAAQRPQFEPLGGGQVARDDLVGITEIRNRLRHLAPLREHLLLGLVDREVELRIERLILPGPPLVIVVGELGAARHQQDQQEERDAEREEYA